MIIFILKLASLRVGRRKRKPLTLAKNWDNWVKMTQKGIEAE